MNKNSSMKIILSCITAFVSAFSFADSADDAVALARRTCDYVAKFVPPKVIKPYRQELEFDAKWLAGEKDPDYRKGIEREIRALRRRILFLHPDLQFDKLLVVQRGIPYTWDLHMVDQYLGRNSRPGPGLVVLENWKEIPRKREILKDKLPKGTVLNPDLHWDADKVVFSFCDHTAKPPADAKALNVHNDFDFSRWQEKHDPTNPALDKNSGPHSVVHHRYFIWEAAIDGSWVRQLTGTEKDPMETWGNRQTVMIEDIDPCYLPDGGIVFSSTRSQCFGRCHWARYTPSFLLYRMNGDGSSIRQLSFGEANEWEPSVLNDGRIAYTRWDYVNRNAVWHQSLWTVKPDGTGVAHLYGNYSENICVATEAKSIPNSNLIVGTAAAHHSLTAGSLFLLDSLKGEDGLAPITRLTPESPFPEGEGWKLPCSFSSPYPVNDTLFFCACSEEVFTAPSGHPRRHRRSQGAVWPKQNSYGIWLIDSLGGRELIYKDPEISTFNPIPIVKQKKKPVLASILPPREKAPTNGLCYVENVYDSRIELKPGSIKALRINRIIGLPICRRRTTKLGPDLDLYKESLGVVPVSADGSCAFRIPAETPIQLQALDENGMAMFTMRSFIYSQKGEIQGCVGCHEQKMLSRTFTTLPKKLQIHDPVREVELGYSGPFNFIHSIQPIFDAKCISCHGLGKAFSLIGIAGQTNLIERKQVSWAKSYKETHYSKPYDYFAAVSPLTKKLQKGHAGVKLTPEEWKKLILWMDFNVPEYALSAGYGWNGKDSREVCPEGEKALREAIRNRLGQEISEQPFDALVNRADEKLSRVLNLIGGEKDRDYQRFLELCRKSLKAHPAEDVNGTCGRDDSCECWSCWVRRGGYNNSKKINAK